MKTLPMNQLIVTGASRGIGQALASLFLERPDWEVTGISRTQSLFHKRYHHQMVDLSDSAQLERINFPKSGDGACVLVNNAGSLGNISLIGSLEVESTFRTLVLNTITPMLLSSRFISEMKDQTGRKAIIQISSGAGRHPIAGWGTYCASKAALDMFSQTTALEQKTQNSDNPIRVFSVAPGIVDTQMQEQIRKTDPSHFPDLERFTNYFRNGMLSNPRQVALHLARIILKPEDFPDVILDIRDFNEHA
jgi:benzil reductase ((S)-benzoin forming)